MHATHNLLLMDSDPDCGPKMDSTISPERVARTDKSVSLS